METEFNFNSQVCTSKVQSERLLALGLKKETADMFYSTILENDDIARVCYEDFWNSNKAIDGYIRRRCIPAWSLHRLMELDISSCKRSNVVAFHMENVNNAYECFINSIEWLIKEGYFNKEYLEE